MKQRYTTYTILTAKIIFITLAIVLTLGLIYGHFIKKDAISEISEIDAKKTSQFIFESLYAGMQKGWNKEDIKYTISRLNKIDPLMEIKIIRSKKVGELFGEIEKDKIVRDSDKLIQKALLGKEIMVADNENFVRYIYPLKAEKQCLKCHINMQENEINGVIDIIYPIENLKISLDKMVELFIVFIIMFSILVFIILFLEFNKYLIHPLQNFISEIKTIYKNQNLSNRIELETNIYEIKDMEEFFNKMLGMLDYQFYTNLLTGLPNRRRLIEDIEKAKYPWIALINIDSFQEINDFYGHEFGDCTLKIVGNKLQTILPDKCYKLYKVHSDEYAILLDKAIEEQEFEEVIYNIILTIQREKFLCNEYSINLNITAGIASNKAQLLIHSDIALNLAKKNKKTYVIYNDDMLISQEYENNIKWTKKLKEAIDSDSIVPYFQPIVNNKSGKIEKYECLARLIDNGEAISPYYFMDIAKKSKLYTNITKVMIEKSFKKFENLNYQFSINLSVDDILDVEVNEFIKELVKHYKSSKNVVFELIESEGIENFEEVLNFIDSVKKCGCQIAIDDFGTGYSNFEYLMKLKVDYIKIDASMIKDIVQDENSQIITNTIVDFATKLGVKTIGEFVCSKEVYDYVKKIGVDYSQGYHLGKPSSEIKL